MFALSKNMLVLQLEIFRHGNMFLSGLSLEKVLVRTRKLIVEFLAFYKVNLWYSEHSVSADVFIHLSLHSRTDIANVCTTGTTISPWIVTLEALEPFSCDAPVQVLNHF